MIQLLMPLQGERATSELIPRALPWAVSFMAFQAVFCLIQTHSQKSYRRRLFESIVNSSHSPYLHIIFARAPSRGRKPFGFTYKQGLVLSLHLDYLRTISNDGGTMCDANDGLPGLAFAEFLQEFLLGLHIEGTCRLVEQKDRPLA